MTLSTEYDKSNYVFQSKQGLRSVQDGGIIIDFEGFVHIFNLLRVRIEINSRWQ